MMFLFAIGLIIIFIGAVVVTLVLVTPDPDQSGLRHEGSQGASTSLTPTGPAEPPPVTSTEETEEYEEQESDYEGGRLPDGAAIPLAISRRERNELAAAASTATDGSGSPERAGRIINSGTIWYGKVYGATPGSDRYYVVASLDSLYFWTSQGDGPWKYEGVFDGRECGPQVPRALTRAWGGGFGKRC
ncbi:hypothetical protein [Streptosporangium sp. LJ11]|uniref:hypothetical protein n=1 Tax=Streptosporangium sp. LJ11 TaxID=3436927 RepID=UPI003F78C92A